MHAPPDRKRRRPPPLRRDPLPRPLTKPEFTFVKRHISLEIGRIFWWKELEGIPPVKSSRLSGLLHRHVLWRPFCLRLRLPTLIPKGGGHPPGRKRLGDFYWARKERCHKKAGSGFSRLLETCPFPPSFVSLKEWSGTTRDVVLLTDGGSKFVDPEAGRSGPVPAWALRRLPRWGVKMMRRKER